MYGVNKFSFTIGVFYAIIFLACTKPNQSSCNQSTDEGPPSIDFVLEETNKLLKHYLVLSDAVVNDTNIQKGKKSNELLGLASKFEKECELYSCQDIVELEKEYLSEVLRILDFNSIEELDSTIVGSVDDINQKIDFPLSVEHCNEYKPINEKIKFKIFLRYSMNTLF